jgi:hypothetical protein
VVYIVTTGLSRVNSFNAEIKQCFPSIHRQLHLIFYVMCITHERQLLEMGESTVPKVLLVGVFIKGLPEDEKMIL